MPVCLNNIQVFLLYYGMVRMVRVEFNYNGEYYNIVKPHQVDDVCKILNVKKSYMQKVTMIATGTCKSNISKNMVKLINDIDLKITPLNKEECDAYLVKRKEELKVYHYEQITKKKELNPKPIRTIKEKVVKEKKVKEPKPIKEKVVKVKKEKVLKPIKRQKAINNTTLKEMINRANGKNTEELQLAYYSVAKRLSNKFWNRDFIEDMIMDAVLTCGKYFIKNVNVEKNVFAYLTELCKRSFAATFNLLNVKDKIGTNEINLIKFII